MSDPEIEAIRKELTARPRPASLAERRQRMDGLSAQFPVPPDVEVEPCKIEHLPAEWTTTPQADPNRVILFIHSYERLRSSDSRASAFVSKMHQGTLQ